MLLTKRARGKGRARPEPESSSVDAPLRPLAEGDRSGPRRTCLGCGLKANKADLVRLVLSSGALSLDRQQVLPGRGVYCCRQPSCYQRLVKQRKRLLWALRCQGGTERGGLVISPELEGRFSSGLLEESL